MNRSQQKLVALIGLPSLLILSVVAAIAFHIHSLQPACQRARARAQLILFAMASTNYHRVLGEWPDSIDDLVRNRSNMVFIHPSVTLDDPWGRRLRYQRFSTDIGYGSIASLGPSGGMGTNNKPPYIECRFQTQGISEHFVDGQK